MLIIYPVASDYVNFKPPRPRLRKPIPKPKDSWPSLRIFRKLRIVAKKKVPRELQTLIRKWQTRRSLSRHAPDAIMKSPPPERLAAYREHLTAIVDQARRRGIAVLLATHAHRFGDTLTPKDRRLLDDWRKFYPPAQGRCLIEMEAQANRIIRETRVSHRTFLVDLARIIPHSNKYFSDSVHFRDSGARIAAKTIAAKILEIDNFATHPPNRS